MGAVVLISDIDECKSTNNPCSANETCSNGLGSYNCTCKEGYRRDENMCICTYLHRVPYMSVHVLMNLINQFGKRDKMRCLPRILSLFFATSLTNSIIQEHEF